MKIIKNLLLLLMFLNTLALFGCSSSGPKFEQFNAPNKEFSSVYFYRPSKMLGSAETINILEHVEPGKENNEDNFEGISAVGKLRNNSYFHIDILPGEHKFTTNWMFDPLIVSLNPSQTYCFKTEPMFLSLHPPLNLIEKDKCIEEISNTNLMTDEDLGNFFY